MNPPLAIGRIDLVSSQKNAEIVLQTAIDRGLESEKKGIGAIAVRRCLEADRMRPSKKRGRGYGCGDRSRDRKVEPGWHGFQEEERIGR